MENIEHTKSIKKYFDELIKNEKMKRQQNNQSSSSSSSSSNQGEGPDFSREDTLLLLESMTEYEMKIMFAFMKQYLEKFKQNSRYDETTGNAEATKSYMDFQVSLLLVQKIPFYLSTLRNQQKKIQASSNK